MGSELSIRVKTSTVTFVKLPSHTHTGSQNMHIRTIHQGEKFNCNLCKATFTRGDSRNIHIRTVHQNERFSCSYLCKATFTHTHTHTHPHWKSKYAPQNYPSGLKI